MFMYAAAEFAAEEEAVKFGGGAKGGSAPKKPNIIMPGGVSGYKPGPNG